MATPLNIFNIDTVRFRVTAQGIEFNIPKTKYSQILDEDRVFENERQLGVKIVGKHGNHNLYIDSPDCGRSLVVQGALSGFLYGQNFFATHKLRPLVIRCLKMVCREMGFKPSEEQKRRWMRGEDIVIELVDVAVNFGLQAEMTVDSALRQAKAQLLFRNGATGAHGTSCYIKPDCGRRWEVKLYGKRAEMSHSKRHEGLPEGARLHDYASGVARVEARVKQSELRDMGLFSLAAWKDDSAKMVFVDLFRRCDLKKITSGPINEKELLALPMRLRLAFCLHKLAGATGLQKLVFGRRTVQRQLADFRKLGIDLGCPNLESLEAADLPSLLVPKNALAVPAWLIEKGLAPDFDEDE